MKRFYVSLIALLLVSVLALFPSVATAQGATQPALPSLDQLWRMSLASVGALAFLTMASYYWGYFVSLISARLPFQLPTWFWQVVLLVPTAMLAAGWNAFATFINATYPGVLDKTVGDAAMWLANYLLSLFWTRRGGLATLAELARPTLRAVDTGHLDRVGRAVLLGG